MLQRLARPTLLLTFTFMAGLAIACSDDPTEPVDEGPLAGLIAQAGHAAGQQHLWRRVGDIDHVGDEQ